VKITCVSLPSTSPIPVAGSGVCFRSAAAKNRLSSVSAWEWDQWVLSVLKTRGSNSHYLRIKSNGKTDHRKKKKNRIDSLMGSSIIDMGIEEASKLESGSAGVWGIAQVIWGRKGLGNKICQISISTLWCQPSSSKRSIPFPRAQQKSRCA
jgi:hypothetical protein